VARVLLLNASYEPLWVVSLHRAIILILEEKAEIIETREGSIRSPSLTLPYPSVIRLTRYIKVPYRRRIPFSNRSVLNRDGYKCAYCGKTATTIDHIIPRSRGGTHEWLNVVAACKTCNHKKGDKLLSEIGWELLIQPTVPEGRKWFVIGIAERESWQEYLEFAGA